MDALSASRRDAVARLCQAQVDGLISIEAFEERYALIQEATTRAALEALVVDLSAWDSTPLPLAGAAPVPAVAAEPPALVPELAGPVRIPSIMASTTRAGQWIVPDHIQLLVVLGEINLDFREALFQSETVVVDLSVTLGSCQITIPPGTQVINELREIATSSAYPRRKGRPVEPNGIVIVLQGRLLFSDIKIREREAGAPSGLAARLGFGNLD